ncbi:MAG: hypothetical protein M3323_01495 [Actinomycetota bacterium]|nr:hypothetical protein [Actinomycetota bacterium]
MNVSKIRRRTAAFAAGAAALAALAPAPAGAQAIPAALHADAEVNDAVVPWCNASGVSTGSSITVLLTVHAVEPGASTLGVRCGIVQDGYVVGYANATGPGVAVGAGTATIAFAPYSVCSDYFVIYLDGRIAQHQGCP